VFDRVAEATAALRARPGREIPVVDDAQSLAARWADHLARTFITCHPPTDLRLVSTGRFRRLRARARSTSGIRFGYGRFSRPAHREGHGRRALPGGAARRCWARGRGARRSGRWTCRRCTLLQRRFARRLAPLLRACGVSASTSGAGTGRIFTGRQLDAAAARDGHGVAMGRAYWSRGAWRRAAWCARSSVGALRARVLPGDLRARGRFAQGAPLSRLAARREVARDAGRAQRPRRTPVDRVGTGVLAFRSSHGDYKPQHSIPAGSFLAAGAARVTERLADERARQLGAERLSQGWHHGRGATTTRSCTVLLPYGELPESERVYDRKTRHGDPQGRSCRSATRSCRRHPRSSGPRKQVLVGSHSSENSVTILWGDGSRRGVGG